MDVERALCTFSGVDVHRTNFQDHKAGLDVEHYGVLWPTKFTGEILKDWQTIPMISCPLLAEKLGVRAVTVRYEGSNESGSMKDYLTEAAILNPNANGSKIFSVVSSGNHAVSLAHVTKKYGYKAVVFTPSSSHKFNYLGKFSHVLAVGIENAVFEDVYRVATKINFGEAIFDANVSNDFLFTAYSVASQQILDACDVQPTHILSGVGNGTYLAGVGFGIQQILGTDSGIKIVPVGMKGAFPTEEALSSDNNLHEYDDFLHPEDETCGAEGSIALESYSMPQLLHAVRSSGGFSLGGLTNLDLALAYTMLVEYTPLYDMGLIPEPTGIMSLAAAVKYAENFPSDSHLVLVFSGAGYKDVEGVIDHGGKYAAFLGARVQRDVAEIDDTSEGKNKIVVPKDIDTDELRDRILDRISGL